MTGPRSGMLSTDCRQTDWQRDKKHLGVELMGVPLSFSDAPAHNAVVAIAVNVRIFLIIVCD